MGANAHMGQVARFVNFDDKCVVLIVRQMDHDRLLRVAHIPKHSLSTSFPGHSERRRPLCATFGWGAGGSVEAVPEEFE